MTIARFNANLRPIFIMLRLSCSDECTILLIMTLKQSFRCPEGNPLGQMKRSVMRQYIELAHMIRKKQFNNPDLSDYHQFLELVA